jgi:phage gp46-like protein
MDIGITWDAATLCGDWSVTSGDLVADPGGLRSAVLLSLFSDRVASTDYRPPAGTPWERRGHWSDTYEPSPLGSRLWQFNRSKKTPALLGQVQDCYKEALQWLVTVGAVSTVVVAASWQQPDVIGLAVTLTPPNAPAQTLNFAWAWQGA